MTDFYCIIFRLAFLLTGRREGLLAAVMYARQHFPQFVSKHEKGEVFILFSLNQLFIELFLTEIQRTMCLLAYEGGVLPTSYASLRDEALWPDAIEVFLKDACALLRLPPLRSLSHHNSMRLSFKFYHYNNSSVYCVSLLYTRHAPS